MSVKILSMVDNKNSRVNLHLSNKKFSTAMTTLDKKKTFARERKTVAPPLKRRQV
jgi:hypothetical protein